MMQRNVFGISNCQCCQYSKINQKPPECKKIDQFGNNKKYQMIESRVERLPSLTALTKMQFLPICHCYVTLMRVNVRYFG